MNQLVQDTQIIETFEKKEAKEEEQFLSYQHKVMVVLATAVLGMLIGKICLEPKEVENKKHNLFFMTSMAFWVAFSYGVSFFGGSAGIGFVLGCFLFCNNG